jgi:hypothetical protein
MPRIQAVELKLTVKFRSETTTHPDPTECEQVLRDLVKTAAHRGMLTSDHPNLTVDDYKFTVEAK